MGGPPFSGGMGPGPYGGRPGWPFKKMMKRCWKNWMRNMMWQQQQQQSQEGGRPCGGGANGAETQDDVKRKDARKDPEASRCRTEEEKLQKERAKCDRAEGGADAEDDVGDEYLRNVGESVAAMLDPLGESKVLLYPCDRTTEL